MDQGQTNQGKHLWSTQCLILGWPCPFQHWTFVNGPHFEFVKPVGHKILALVHFNSDIIEGHFVLLKESKSFKYYSPRCSERSWKLDGVSVTTTPVVPSQGCWASGQHHLELATQESVGTPLWTYWVQRWGWWHRLTQYGRQAPQPLWGTLQFNNCLWEETVF